MSLTIPFTFVPNTTIESSQVNANFAAIASGFTASVPTVLTSPTTFYVATTGSDTVTGLNPAQPAATMGHIISQLYSLYNVNGQIITIQLANGSYTESVTIQGNLPGQRAINGLIIQGNTGSPSLVTVSGGPCFLVVRSAMAQIQGMTLTSPANNCLIAAETGLLNYQNVVFSTAAGAHVYANQLGECRAVGDYTISGGAALHLLAKSGVVLIEGAVGTTGPPPAPVPNSTPTVTVTGTPNFSTAFVHAGVNSAVYCSAVFSGAATGNRGLADSNGVIQTFQNPNALTTYFPGSVNPTTASGGQIV